MKISTLFLSTSLFACAVAPVHADPIADLFAIVTDLDNSNGSLSQEKDGNGNVISVTGTIDGETVVFTPSEPISQTTQSVEITATNNGTKETIELTTSGGGIRNINEGDVVSISGEIEGLTLDVSAAVPSEDGSSLTGTLNGNSFEVSIPDGKTFEDYDADVDAIVVTKDGEEVFSGIIADISEVQAATLASEFEVVSTNPLSALAMQATSLGGFFSLVSDGAYGYGANGFSFNVAKGNNGEATHGYSPFGKTSFDSSFNYGVWAHSAYNEREIQNSIGTFDTSLATTALGGHAVFNEDYLVGFAAGLQFADSETRGTTSNSNFDVAMFSPYVAARFLDGSLIAELALIYGLIDVDTRRAASVTGNTRGHRFGGRFALGYSRAVTDNFSIMTKAGVMVGYDRYDAFTESNGVDVDSFEIGVGIFDISVSGQYQVNERLTLKAGAKGFFDFSNDVLNNDFVQEFDNSGVEFTSGLTFKVSDRISADLNGTYEMGINDQLTGKGVNGTIRISF